MHDKLRIGKTPYVNLFPVFHTLEASADRNGYEFVEGYPSTLNRMLREGEIDLSPSSSIEYLRDKDAYFYIDGHSISSYGAIGSILFFSRVPIESLGPQPVYATHQSETSVALLKILLKEFYGRNCDILTSAIPFEKAIETHSAYLSIGDEALAAGSRAHGIEAGDKGPDYRLATIGHQLFYIYDLAELWHDRTGLPFVFALWIGRDEMAREKKELLERFKQDLDTARENAGRNFQSMAEECGGLPLRPEEIVLYWKGIYYGFSDECRKGLSLFERYLRETGLLPG
jgi:chorismate dehydratase